MTAFKGLKWQMIEFRICCGILPDAVLGFGLIAIRKTFVLLTK